MTEERRKELDAFYTPIDICYEIAMRLKPDRDTVILDPMCGDGRLLEAVNSLYRDERLTLVGVDIDCETINLCRDKNYVNFDWYVTDFKDNKGQTYGADYIVMNPCFYKDVRYDAIKYAFDNFSCGVIYVPFDEELIRIMAGYRFKRLEMKEYDPEYLKTKFACDITNRQGYIFWKGRVKL